MYPAKLLWELRFKDDDGLAYHHGAVHHVDRAHFADGLHIQHHIRVERIGGVFRFDDNAAVGGLPALLQELLKIVRLICAGNISPSAGSSHSLEA